MAHATKRKEVKSPRKKALHKQDRSYQPPYQPAMNSSFELGHSRIHEALSKREEISLFKWFVIFPLVMGLIGIVLGVISAI